MQGLNFIAIDFETANSSRASICEAGICVVRDGSVQETRSWLVRPQGNVYNYWNTKIHGLCRKDTDDAPIFPQVWNKISKYLRNLPLVAHNKSFDERCLKAVFAYYHMKYPDYPFYCTYRSSVVKFPDLENHQLQTVAAYCGFDLTKHHHALADAEACARIGIEVFNNHSMY